RPRSDAAAPRAQSARRRAPGPRARARAGAVGRGAASEAKYRSGPGGVENLLNQRVVFDAHGGRRLREIVHLRERRIGIGLQDDQLAGLRQAEVDAAEPANLEHAVDAPRDPVELSGGAVGKILRRDVLDAPL